MAARGPTVIIGQSKEIGQVLQLIDKVSTSKTNILITGESGTGKELVARLIHESGPLKDGPFIPVNCGAIPENLIESELFGHKRGSFTGAIADKPGLFEAAEGGTLFLDEVGELPLPLQVKLLRALQERTTRRVGSNEDIKVNARVIAATNRNLEEASTQGTFREDLYYRLNVINIRTPALRERRSDIPILAEHFLRKFADRNNKTLVGFEPAAIEALTAYSWPGNVRELENTLERASILENKNKVSLEALPVTIRGSSAHTAAAAAASAKEQARTGSSEPEIRLPAPDFSKGALGLDQILGEIEKIYIRKALEHSRGVKKAAADLLGITFRSIRYRLKKLGMETGPDEADEAGEGDEAEK